MPTLQISPQGLTLEVAHDAPIADALHEARAVAIGCHDGHCMACAVWVMAGEGQLSAPSPTERYTLSAKELAGGMRLACQLRVRGEGVTLREWRGERQRP